MASTLMWSLVATLLLLVQSSMSSTLPHAKFGIMVVEDELESSNICIKFYPELHNLSSDPNLAVEYNFGDLVDLRLVDTCEDSDPSGLEALVNGKMGFVGEVGATNVTGSGNCSVAQRAHLLESHKSQGLLTDTTVSSKFNSSNSGGPTQHPVASIYYQKDAEEFLRNAFGNKSGKKFKLYAPEEEDKSFDGSIVVIFVMAVFTVCAGSLWSGYTKHHLRKQQMLPFPTVSNTSTQGGQANAEEATAAVATTTSSSSSSSSTPRRASQQSSRRHEEELSLKVSPLWVIGFVVCMCGMLVMLYFFFNQLVYLIIGMFVLATITSTYACLEPIIMWTYTTMPCLPTLQLPKCNLYLCALNMELRQFILFCLSISLSVVWAVFRNEEWAWILQDILGIMFSVNMLRVLRLPSLKICTILLGVLFFYDIFFVFVTPLITSDGKSIMVEVATGGDTGEQLPMVLKVPHLGREPLKACWVPYSMLGFGDILVPGLLLSYCHSFDLLKGTPCKVYWAVSVLCYSVSLLICFVGLFLMNYAQPALLYIVPCTLIPVSLIALCRGEFREMWEGDKLSEELPKHDSLPRDDQSAPVGSGGGGRRSNSIKDEEIGVTNDEEEEEQSPDTSAATNTSGNSDSNEEDSSNVAKRTRAQTRKKEDDVQKLLE